MGSSSSHENVDQLGFPHPKGQPNCQPMSCNSCRLKAGTFRVHHKGPVVGIDLGTTNSCVAVFHDGRVDVIANEHSNHTTPSCVTFTDRDRLVGEAGVRQMAFNPENTVFGIKRLMGQRFDDPHVQSILKECPFKVVAGHDNKAKVQVTFKGTPKEFYPEEISAMILYKLRQMAESYVGRPVTQAVITVPLYFNDAQRQATIDAAAIAGLTVLELVKEPFAAAVAYRLNKTHPYGGPRNIAVFNMGGGTLNLSILTYQNDAFEIKGTTSFNRFGGEDFNRALMGHLVEEFKKVHKRDPTKSKTAMQKLRVACENAKRDLSCSVIATVSVEGLCSGVDFHTAVTRATFEDLCADLFQSIWDPMEQMMDSTGIKNSQIHDVLLVGGSSRIPVIQKLLSKFFEGRELVKSINPEEVLAHGAATLGALMTGYTFQSQQNLIFLDVTPLSLGIETVGGSLDVVIKRNTPIPTKESRNYTTTEDNQESICLQVYEGERVLNKHNNLLGKFTLSGIRPAPRGSPNIVVEFEIDYNNILTVSATETCTGVNHQLTITDNRGRLNKEEMERITKEEEEFRACKKEEKEKTEALNSLESTTRRLKRAADTEAVDERAKRRVLEMCEETITWLESNKLAPKKEYEERKRELEDVGYSIISHFSTGAKKC